jgi:hypothetical protein
VRTILTDRPPNKTFANNGGFKQPEWLPNKSAADQAAVLALALNNHYLTNRDTTIRNYINILCEGIIHMQVGDILQFPHGAFLSWQNTWHGWGNIQAYTLLKCATTLNDNRYSKAAIKEIDTFYDFLITHKFYNAFKLSYDGKQIFTDEISTFPQIAYIIRPMVFACLEAYQQTQNAKYAEKAGKIAAWFFGMNPAEVVMYDSSSGRCFDGIINEQSVNKNSGAESTIEALLALLLVEKNSIALKTLTEKIQSRK